MKHLTSAVEMSVVHGNWYSALTLALTLPDICSKIDEPTERSVKKRYTRWASRYFTPKYTRKMGANRTEHIFLPSNDFYALRCAVLHEGSDSVMEQTAREVLDRFQIIAPPSNGNTIHCNQLNTQLQLQVDLFCTDICEAVTEWYSGVAEGSERAARVSDLMKIREFRDGEGFSF